MKIARVNASLGRAAVHDEAANHVGRVASVMRGLQKWSTVKNVKDMATYRLPEK